MSELVRYEAARRALAEAVAVDEVMQICDQAEALRHAARIAGDKVLEIQAAQIRFRAERRFGELMAAQHAAGKVARGGRPRSKKTPDELSGVSGELPEITLRDIGVDYRFSSRAQKLAELPEADFDALCEQHADEMRSGKGRVAMDLLKIDAEAKGRAHRRNLAAALSEHSATLPSGQLFPAVYLDPPWHRHGGIGDRAYENHYPTMSWPEILAYLRQASASLLPDAWAFMWIPRAHLLAPVELELEAMVVETGQLTPVKLEAAPLAWACQLALGMDSYSTSFVWTKTDADHPDVSGSGLIAFDQDELLLLFKRGRGLPKPAACEKFGSNHRERPREHSRKPDHYRRMIASMVGCDEEGRPLPVLELFARVDAEHPLPPGWRAAGNQAGENSPANAGDHVVVTSREALAAIDPVSASAVLVVEADRSGLFVWKGDFAAGVPSDAGEAAAAAADATDGASPVAAVAENPEPVFPPAELYELKCFAARGAVDDEVERARRAEVARLAPAYVRRGLVHEWCGEWRLTPAGVVRIGIVERERSELYRLAQRALSFFEFTEWHDLEAVASRQELAGVDVRHLVGLDLAGVNTVAFLTEAGARRLAELEAAIDAAAGLREPPATPIAPKQLDLVEILQGAP